MLRLHTATFNAFSENTYIIYNEKKDCWIVDPGMSDKDELAAFHSFIDQERLKPQSIINTHAHIDHILGVQDVMDRYNIPFFLHPLDEPVLKGAIMSARMFGLEMNSIPQPTDWLESGKLFSLGEDNLEIRLAPGHSPGSVVFYYKQGSWLVGGDVLFAGSIGRTDLPGGHHATLIKSIQTEVLTLPDETIVFPGHGPATTIGRERRSNPFLIQ